MFKLLSAFLFVPLFLFSKQSPSLTHALVGAYAVDMDTGKVLFDENSDKSFIPASCMKVVTTAAALHLLGSESHFETKLAYDGTIDKKGTLSGNLYIEGGGDPCLGSKRLALSWKEQIGVWVDAIYNAGIRKIKGEVIADASRWESALAVSSWLWEDLGNYYGAGACALSFHENTYFLFFQPGAKVGDPTQIVRTEPPVSSLHLKNEVKTGPIGSGDQACIYSSEFSSAQIVRGTIPAGVSQFTIKGAIPDPATCCAHLLLLALQQKGIVVENQKLSQTTKAVLHTTSSPSMGEIIHMTNQKSINLYAEHLLKRMGEEMEGVGSTQAGIYAVEHFLSTQNIPLSGFHMVDGSGLSRKNLITPKQCVSLLLHMKNSEHFPLFLESLPQKHKGRHAKTGSMSLVRGCVGYKGSIAFAVLVNQGVDGEEMEKEIELLLSKLE